MPTPYAEQFYQIDPSAPPAGGTPLAVFDLTLVDQNSNGFISRSGNDSLDGSDITNIYPGDTVTVLRNGVNVTITGATIYLADGRVFFTPTDGEVLQNSTFVSSTFVTGQSAFPVSALGPPCFVEGTRLATPDGERAVEELRVGDRVLTRDNGPQPIRWIGSAEVPGTGRFAPVRIAAGSLGNRRDLWVSPQHRMLVSGWRAELMAGEAEVLVAAKDLVDGVRITRAPRPSVCYWHLLFDRHELVLAEGAVSESFFPGDEILRRDDRIAAEIAALFPELSEKAAGHWKTARPVVSSNRARALMR
ncbi:MAG: Hint domain-containing protein [Paracoccaceae bacterium]